jgi:hypothetical protein
MVKDFAKENRGYIKGAALLLPLTLTGCNHPTNETVQLTTNWPTINGFIVGSISAIEEVFEKDPNKNIGRKTVSIGLKFAAGFGLGSALTHNLQNGNSWISHDNLPSTISFIPSTYVIVRETNIKELLTGLGSLVAQGAKKGVDKITEGSRQYYEEKRQKDIATADKMGDVRGIYRYLKRRNWRDEDIFNYAKNRATNSDQIKAVDNFFGKKG